MNGKEKWVEKELIRLVPLTRREPGCINYDLHRSADNLAIYLFCENWVNRKALDEHLKMPYLREFSAKSGQLLKKPMELSFYTMISNTE